MIKFCNYNIILPKHFEIVKKEGKPAEKIAVGSEGEAEGGCGGNSASPEPKRSPAVLLSKSRESQKSFLYLLEEKRNCARKSKNKKKTFLRNGERKRAAAGLSVSFVQKRFGFRQTNAPERKSQKVLVRLAEAPAKRAACGGEMRYAP